MPEGYLEVLAEDEKPVCTLAAGITIVVPEIVLVNLDSEVEEREALAISLCLKRYRRLFRYLFDSYSNTCYMAKKQQFEQMQERYEQMGLGELRKLLRDHAVTDRMISREEIAALLRLINLSAHRNDMISLTRKGFADFFVQMSIRAFANDSPLVNAVEQMVEHFRTAEESSRGKASVLYRNPDATALGDPDVLTELNRAVAKNPAQILPEGYAKVEEESLRFEHVLSRTVAATLPESLRITVELLDSIVSDSFDQHFVESVSRVEGRIKVCPLVQRPQKRLMLPRFMESVTPDTEKKQSLLSVSEHTVPFSAKNGSSPEIAPRLQRRGLSPAVKLAIALLPHDTRQLGYEVGEVLERVLRAVESGKAESESPRKKTLREASALDAALEEKAREQKRTRRWRVLKQRLDRVRQDKDKERDEKAKEAEEAQKRTGEQTKRRQEAEQKARAEAKKKIEERRTRLEEEKQMVRQAMEQKVKQESERKSKTRAAFLRSQKDSIVPFHVTIHILS